MKKYFFIFAFLFSIAACQDNPVEPQEDSLFQKTFYCFKGDTVLIEDQDSIKLELAYDGYVDKDMVRFRYTGLPYSGIDEWGRNGAVGLNNGTILNAKDFPNNKYQYILLYRWQYWMEIIDIKENIFVFKFLKESPLTKYDSSPKALPINRLK